MKKSKFALWLKLIRDDPPAEFFQQHGRYLDRLIADSKRLDKLEKVLGTDQIVSVECGYYDHGTGEGGFFLCDLSDKQLCGHTLREAIDKLKEHNNDSRT